MMLLYASSLVAALLLPCCAALARAQVYPTRFENVTWDDKIWRLTTTYADQGHFQSRATLSNGYLGIALAALGPFFEADVAVNGDNINGWPLFQRRQTFATVAGFWDVQATTEGSNFPWLNQYGGESVISGIPHYAGFYVEVNGHILKASTDSSQVKNFSSSWDFRRGVLHWAFTWTAPASPAIEVEYQTFVHKLYVHRAATQLKLKALRNVNVTVHDVFDGDCAVRSGFVNKRADNNTIWSGVHPDGLPAIEAYVFSRAILDNGINVGWRDSTEQLFGARANASSISQASTLQLTTDHTTTLHKFVGGASSDAVKNPFAVARRESAAGAQLGWKKLLAAHAAEWRRIMDIHTVDSFHLPNGSLPDDQHIIEAQINAITIPYQILQNTVSANALKAAGNNTALVETGIPVGGWGSDSYGGLEFWDEDTWMFPGLVLAYPEDMKTVPNYRRARYAQATENAQTAFSSSQNMTTFPSDAAIYSWTSGRFGNCTGTGPCWDYEYHLNGDIVVAMDAFALTTGDLKTFNNDYFPIYNSVATVYSNLLQLNKTSKTWVLTNATDPDEFANNVDNPGYTMYLMQHVLNRANDYRAALKLPRNSTWETQAKNVEIPEDRAVGLHLEFTGMNGSIQVKQADVVLLYDLLNVDSPYRTQDLNFYAGRQSLGGPGLTFSVFSIVTALAATSGCASYTYSLWAAEPYARAPWFQFSEQLLDDYDVNGGFHPAYPFLTGMGGQARITVFAYLGYHILTTDSLNIDPSLPPQIPRIKYRTLYWRGWGILIVSNQTHTVLQRAKLALDTADMTYAKNGTGAPIPVTIGNNPQIHQLTAEKPLILPTRRPSENKTIPHNLAQCLTATSNTAFLPGQFPIGAIDGAALTKWQPSQASQNSTLTVHLGAAGLVPVAGFSFDWGQSPPISWSVSFSNSTPGNQSTSTVVASQSHVKISKPYDPATINQVQPYSSNTTHYTLPEPVWGGRYASLTIKGNQAHDGTENGASVAEWAIVADTDSAGSHRAMIKNRNLKT